MPRIENSTEIGTNPERVSEYLWDANNLPNYLPMSDIWVMERKEDFVRLSHKFTAAGRTSDFVCETKRLENGMKIEYKSTSGMGVQGTWLLEPKDKGTRVTYVLEYRPPGWIFGVILDKLITAKEMKRIASEGLQKLKAILEK